MWLTKAVSLTFVAAFLLSVAAVAGAASTAVALPKEVAATHDLQAGPNPKIQEMVNKVDADRMYSQLAHLVNNLSMPDRYFSSQNYMKAADWVKSEVEKTGLKVWFEDFPGSLRNVIAEQPGTDLTLPTMVVGGHLDSVRNAPGADDDGSGVVATMHMAEIMSKYKFKNTIRYVWWSNEEGGLVGSNKHAQNASGAAYKYGGYWDVDMIAYNPGATYSLGYRVNTNSQWMVDLAKLDNTDYAIGFQSVDRVTRSGNSDQSSFWAYGYAAVEFTVLALSPNYHKPTDTMQVVNKEFLKRCTQISVSGVAGSAVPDSGGGGNATIDKITVTPPTATVQTGAQKQFNAQALDAQGNPLPATFTWATTGGTVSAGGLYTAPGSAGTFTVFANASAKSGTATVSVSAGGQLQRMEIDPPFKSMLPGETVTLTAKGYDVNNQPVVVNPVWTAAGGSIVPSGATAVYTAEKVGQWSVDAAEGAITAGSSITTAAGPAVSALVDPPTATVAADKTLQLKATGKDKYDNPIDPLPVTWTVSASDAGTVDSAGLYNPKKVGSWTITGTAVSGVSATSQVTVTPGALKVIAIDPPGKSLKVGESQAFTATGVDLDGNDAGAVQVTWSVSPAAVGDIDQNGKFTARQQGTANVKAVAAAISKEVQVTVTAGGGGGGGGGSTGGVFGMGPTMDIVIPLIIVVAIVGAIAAMMMMRRKKQAPAYQQNPFGGPQQPQQGQQWNQQGYDQPGPPQGGQW